MKKRPESTKLKMERIKTGYKALSIKDKKLLLMGNMALMLNVLIHYLIFASIASKTVGVLFKAYAIILSYFTIGMIITKHFGILE